MFSAAAVIGMMSVFLFLGATAYFLRELGAADLAKAILAVAAAGFMAAMIAALLF